MQDTSVTARRALDFQRVLWSKHTATRRAQCWLDVGVMAVFLLDDSGKGSGLLEGRSAPGRGQWTVEQWDSGTVDSG